MKQEQQTSIKDDDSKTEIEQTCFYSQCKFCRLLCQQCKIDASQKHKTHIASKGDYQKQQELLKQSISDAKFEVFEFGNQEWFNDGGISNDLKYVVIEHKKYQLQIWDYQTKFQIKAIKLNDDVRYVKFTDDSRILYVMTKGGELYKYNVNDQFKQMQRYYYRRVNDSAQISNMYCISNEILLASSSDGNITKTNVQQNKQLLKLKAHSDYISGLDYNKNLNIIVSGSYDKSIKLWNANKGQQLIEKYFEEKIFRVLFIANNQLIILDFKCKVMVWNINYQSKQLQLLKIIDGINHNIQIVLHQQFIVLTGKQSVKVYSIDGEFIRAFDQNHLILYFDIIQPDSLQARLLQIGVGRKNKQVILKIRLD